MSKLVAIQNAHGNDVYVADIKKECIENIIESIKLCKQIDKVVLFGSCIEERCTERSDIDIAVFGHKTHYAMYQLEGFKKFARNVRFFGELQEYDILYFNSNKDNKDRILDNINKGEILYEKEK